MGRSAAPEVLLICVPLKLHVNTISEPVVFVLGFGARGTLFEDVILVQPSSSGTSCLFWGRFLFLWLV